MTATTAPHGFPFQVRVTDVVTGEVVFDSGATWAGAMQVRKMFMADGFHVAIDAAR